MAFTINLYLIELSGGKYYVCQTDDVEASFLAHQLGTGFKWSKLYPTLRLAKTRTIEVPDLATALKYENWVTLQYMERYGWTNVRGGDYLATAEYLLQQ